MDGHLHNKSHLTTGQTSPTIPFQYWCYGGNFQEKYRNPVVYYPHQILQEKDDGHPWKLRSLGCSSFRLPTFHLIALRASSPFSGLLKAPPWASISTTKQSSLSQYIIYDKRKKNILTNSKLNDVKLNLYKHFFSCLHYITKGKEINLDNLEMIRDKEERNSVNLIQPDFSPYNFITRISPNLFTIKKKNIKISKCTPTT